jgi:C4-dicarboxylate transporter DctM subunit
MSHGAMIGVMGIVVLLLVLFLLGTPVGFAMALVGFAGYCYIVSVPAALSMVGNEFWAAFSSYGMTVIPLFVFMGQIAFYTGVSRKLFDAAYAWVGHIRGGLAAASVLACAAFATICGSNTATAATMATVALPEMKKYGYHPLLSVGSVAAGSTLGVVIPPSVVLIVIGLYANQSIAKLFYGGFSAGIVLTVMMVATVWVLCKIHPEWGPAGVKATWRQRFAALPGAFEMVLLFLLVIVGLYLGWFTPSEAGAIGSFFAIVIALFQGKMNWKVLSSAIKDTMNATSMVLMIVAGAFIFGKFLTVTRMPFELADWVAGLPVAPVVILMVVFVIYMIGGMIMDALALLIITIPIFFPLAEKLGYDPLWFGVVLTVITTMGAITPPVAATMYVVAGVAKDVPMKTVFKAMFLFVPSYLVSVGLYMAFPQIITAFTNPDATIRWIKGALGLAG